MSVYDLLRWQAVIKSLQVEHLRCIISFNIMLQVQITERSKGSVMSHDWVLKWNLFCFFYFLYWGKGHKSQHVNEWWPKIADSPQKLLCPTKVGVDTDHLTVWRSDIKTNFFFRLDGRHVVFGSVKEGMDVVKKVESYGSRSGRTSKRISITDCGELK